MIMVILIVFRVYSKKKMLFGLLLTHPPTKPSFAWLKKG
jgi:hypothetical protein